MECTPSPLSGDSAVTHSELRGFMALILCHTRVSELRISNVPYTLRHSRVSCKGLGVEVQLRIQSIKFMSQ